MNRSCLVLTVWTALGAICESRGAAAAPLPPASKADAVAPAPALDWHNSCITFPETECLAMTPKAPPTARIPATWASCARPTRSCPCCKRRGVPNGICA